MQRKNKIVLGLLAVIIFIMYGACMGIQTLTFVNWRIVLVLCIGLSLVSGIFTSKIWRGLTCTNRMWINYLLNTYIVCAILLMLFYVPNFAFSNRSETVNESAVIERVFYKTRYKKKRISRRTYGRGEPYKVYYIDICFEDGTEKTISIPLQKYNRLHRGDSLVFEVRKGLWGMKILDTNFKMTEHKLSKSKIRKRFRYY